MRSTDTDRNTDAQQPSEAGERMNPRDKVTGMRLSIDELEEVESAAKRSGKKLAEWLRDLALREARQRPDGPFEQILKEISASRVLSGQIAQQVKQTTQQIPQLVSQSTNQALGQALARVEEDTLKAIRNVTVSGVGAKISPIADRLATIEEVLRKLKRYAERAEEALTPFNKFFQWQQIAISVFVGIAIGGAGSWYFASRPLKEATDYILHLKEAQVSPPDATQSTPSASHHPAQKPKPKSTRETQPQTDAAPVPVPQPQ